MSHEELLEYLQREKERLFQYASYRLPEKGRVLRSENLRGLRTIYSMGAMKRS